ncbi:hypothetical protein [Haematobacter massiliensis]|uniref:hypothetical protein n=1 Tax=Haematobacter massiliensis TaxID=195105 RepID=UPI0023F09A5A|nr:hypothetical protein [Haematobacter massiliensis]
MSMAGRIVEAGTRPMGIFEALHWAFAVEHARLLFDRPSVSTGRDSVAAVAARGALGVAVDGGGRSDPHPDADEIALAVTRLPSNRGGQAMAEQIARLARGGIVPDWYRDETPRVIPAGVRRTKHGLFAETQIVGEVSYRYRGREVTADVVMCPVTYAPSAAVIAAARRNYLDWWSALLHVAHELSVGRRLCRIDLTAAMPPMSPWRAERRE